MHSRRIVLLTVSLIAWTAAPARADTFLSPFVGYNYGSESTNCPSLTDCQDKRMNWGASIGSTSGLYGLEEDISYTRDFFGKTAGQNNSLLTLMTNLMLVVPAGPVQVYGLIGLGLVRPHMTFDSDSLSLSKNALGYDIGGGLNIFFTHGFGVRGDVRHIKTLQDITLGVFTSDEINFWRASAGVTFRF